MHRVTWAVSLGVVAVLATPALSVRSADGSGAPSWQIVSSPVSSGVELLAVAGSGPKDVWALGSRWTARSALVAYGQHFDGRQWTVVRTPSTGDWNQFRDAIAFSPTDAWAVGFATNYATLIEHWDGVAWRMVSSPTFGQDRPLYGISGTSSNDIWVAGEDGRASTAHRYGRAFVAHFDGTSWTRFSAPSPGDPSILYRVAAISPTDAWAVGDAQLTTDVPLVEHWDGVRWSRVPAPHPGNSVYVRGLVASGPSDIWFVGNWFGNPPRYDEHPLVEHWDGNVWSLVRSPAGNEPSGMAERSQTDAWMVGDTLPSTSSYFAALEHWNGQGWTSAESPVMSSGNSELDDVSRLPDGTLWAVGATMTDGVSRALTIRLAAG